MLDSVIRGGNTLVDVAKTTNPPHDVQLHLTHQKQDSLRSTIRGTIYSVSADSLTQLRVCVRVGDELITVPVPASEAIYASLESLKEVECTIDPSKVRVYQH